MHEVKIKPLSVNAAWQGRRFKSKAYEAYEKELSYLLPKMRVSKGSLRLWIIFGIQKMQDIDSGLKQFIDVCQKKYEFNDRDIMGMIVEKRIVKKGEEYIQFEISPCRNCY